MKHISLFEQFTAIAVELVNEKREDVGKYNTVKKVIAKIGKRPSEQDLAQFITDNYYDVTEVEQGNDDERANDKIADLVGFLKYDIKDWNAAWTDAQNESVLHEANKGKVHKAAKQGSYPAVIVVVKDGKVIHQEPVSTPEVAPATFNVMQEKYPKALIHLEDKTGKRLFSESVVTGFTEAKMTKDKLENLIYSLENENDSWHPSSDSKKKSMLDKLKKDLSKFESVVTEEVAYNSSNTKPEAAKQATKEFGKLLPKANKGVEPYVFAVVKTKARNYRLAIKSGSYVAHEFMSGLKEDGILTADIVKKAVANVIKLNPEEFNESVVNEALASGSKIEKNLNKALKSNINMFGDNDETIKVLDTPVRIERSQYDKEMNGRSKNFGASIMYMYGSVTNEYNTSAVIGVISRTKGTAKVFLYSEETYGKFAKGASFKEYEGASVLAEFQNKTRDVVSHLSKFPADGSANESMVNEASADRIIKQIERALKDGTSIFKLPMATQNYYNKNKGDFEVVTEARPGTKTYYHDRDVLPPHYGNSELHDKSEEMFKKSWKKLNDKQKDEVLSSFPKNESVVTEASNQKWKVVDSNGNEVAGPDAKHIMVDYAKQKRGWKAVKVAESVVIESKNSKEIKELEKLLKSIKSNTPADQGRKASIQDDIERLKNESAVNEAENYITGKFKVGDKIKTGFGEWEVIETDYAPKKSFIGSFIFKGKDMARVNIPNPPKTNKNAIGYKVTDGDKYPIIGFLYQYKDITKLATVGVDESVTEAKNTIGLAFKEEQDYLDFKEFVAEQPRGAIRKNIGFDSKTKSWNVEMDVKVLDSIYGEGTPSDKKSGWYGGLPDDFESVIIESVVTEGIKKGATVSYQAFHASNHPSGSYRYEVKANVLSVSGKEAKITYKDQDGKTKTIEVEIEKLSEAFAESVVTEGKMPNKLINDDDIVFLKTSENSKGAHYNVYYKGHDIDFGGVGFGTEKQLKSYAKEYILSRQWANKLRWEDAKPLPESVVTEARNYKESPDGKHKVKATVCYIKPMSGKRECKAIYFKSKHDALGFKDNVKGFPKGAAVEAIKESNMKYTTLFEEFIKKTKSVSSQNEAVKVTPESDIKIDDYTSDNGEEIKAVEIVGAISSSETEDEFLDYFYDAYGQGAFTETDTSTLVKYFNDYLEEITAKETEEEEAEKEGGGEEEDPLADLDI